MLSGKGELHAACAGRGSINCPGPLLADAAGGHEVRMRGATSQVVPPCRQAGLMPAALAERRAGNIYQKGGAGLQVLPRAATQATTSPTRRSLL
jgi:hypothetical protein